MMWAYILKLVFLVPLVAGLAFGAIWLWRKVQPGMMTGQRDRLVKLVDAIPLGATGKVQKMKLREQFKSHVLASPT